MDKDISHGLRDAVLAAAADNASLIIRGGNSKAFYGRRVLANTPQLEVVDHAGIVSYEPTELVISARAGTPLKEIEAVLAEGGQMLGFEPPHFGETATLGGTIACGLSGPRRPYAGSARDFVLGVKLLNGKGETLSFGGQVMKNVAGYDVSRLMTGALGTLGVILEVSLKVLPRPTQELTLLLHPLPAKEALKTLNRWANKPYPISAAAHDGKTLYVRLSGAVSAVEAARRQIGGDALDRGGRFWQSLREHTHSFFKPSTPLWRLSLPPATPPLDLSGSWLLDWGGAQRWLHSSAPAAAIRQVAASCGGHATLFRGGERQGQVFHPLDPVVQQLHRNLKNSFDPHGIFNPGRMYPDF